MSLPSSKLSASLVISLRFIYFQINKIKQSDINPKEVARSVIGGHGHTGPKCGPQSMDQVQWRTATNPLHTYQMHESPVSTFHENDKKE